MEKLSRIIEQVYSAALDPALWPAAVSTLRERFACASAGLYVDDLRRKRLDVLYLSGIDSAYVRTYIEEFAHNNPWAEALTLQVAGRIRTEHSLDEYYRRPGFYRSTTYFNEWMKPQDFIYTLGTNLAADRRARTKVFLYRAGRTGPYSRADIERFACLSRHLLNAIKVGDRLGQRTARAEHALDLLERLDVGVAFLDDEGRVIEANGFAEAVFARAEGLRIERGTVVAAHRSDAAKVKALLRSALELYGGRTVDVPPAVQLQASRSKGRSLQIRVIPLPPYRGGTPFFGRSAAAMLVIADRERDSVVSADELQRLYGLTAAESRLVQWLLCGVSLRQASELMQVTYETARSYLKNVFQKTGVRRQAELVRQILNGRATLN